MRPERDPSSGRGGQMNPPSTNHDLSTAKRLYYLSVIRAVAVVNKVKRAIWKVVVSKEGN